MEKIDDTIKKASALFDVDLMCFTTYCNIYPWTNEPLIPVFEELCEEGSKVLCITSSGDHPINAIARGCTDITTFDINALTSPYFDLKLAALLSFDKETFLSLMPATFSEEEYYYTSYLLGKLSESTYKNIKESYNIDERKYEEKKAQRKDLFRSNKFLSNLKNISITSYEIWNKLYSLNSNLLDSKLFKLTHCGDIKDIIENNNYLQSDEVYNEVKERIPKVNIHKITSDILTLPTHLKKRQFDFVHLSNVINVATSSFQNGFVQYSEFLQDNIYPLVNLGGTVVVNYFQSTSEIMEEMFKEISMHDAFEKTNNQLECLYTGDTAKVYYKTL